MQRYRYFLSRRLRYLPRWVLLITWGLLILCLSVIPSPPCPQSGLLSWDKLQHSAAYGLLTFLGCLVTNHLSSNRARGWILAAFAAIVYGGIIELVQGLLTKNRTAELGDFVADGVGAFTILVAFAISDYLASKRSE